VRSEGRDADDARNIPSPAYIYDVIKPAGSCSTGSKISDALDLLKTGAGSLSDFPYSDGECDEPSPSARARAVDFRIDKWQLVDLDDLDQVKAELYKNNPVIISLHDSVAFQRLKSGDILRGPGRYRGWHAITVVGYDEGRQPFKLINSCGRRWGDHGFGWISYAAFRADVSAAYVMHVAATPRPQPPPPEPKPPAPVAVVIPHPACSNVSLQNRDGKPTVVGFVGYEKDLAAIREAAKGAAVDVQLRPWPQCEALLTLAKVLPRADAPLVTIRAAANRTLHARDHLVFEIETPPYPSYLHVTYFQADGSAVNLMQPGDAGFKAYPPRSRVVLGADTAGRRFRVSAPYGHEMLLVLAARSPVFPDSRPVQETQRQFLTALRHAFLYKTDPTLPDRTIDAGYDTIVTEDAIETNRRSSR
jgi:hypothetical protein